MDNRQYKFEKLAEKRVTEVVNKLRLISNLANKKNYSYSDAHYKQIFKVIDDEVRSMKSKFLEKNQNEKVFKFKK
jgi:hypothetical protein